MENTLTEKSALIYKQAFYQSPAIMSISTLDEGRYIEVNQAFTRILGYQREEIIGHTSNELGIWAEGFSREDMLARLQEEGRFEDLEINLRAKSGEIKCLLSTFEIIESNGERCILNLLQDITARKSSESELAASQKRLHQIADLAQDIIYSITLTPQMMFDFISPSIESLLGYSVAEIQNDPKWILAHIHPEDRNELASFFSFPEREPIPQPIVLRWYHRDGHCIPVEHRISLVYDKNGIITGFVGIGRDITQRRQAEEQNLLNEARSESLVRLSQFSDPDFQHLLDYALQEAIRLTGSKIGSIYHYFENNQELVLNTWSKALNNECKIMEPQAQHQLKTSSLWGEAIRQRRPIILNDFQAPNPIKKGYPPGHVELLRFLSVPVFNGDKIVAVVGVANKAVDYDQSDVRQLTLLMDSTWRLVEHRRAEEHRRLDAQKLAESYVNEQRQRQELQEEAKARGLFIDILAHELRTPLTPILASSGMLIDILKEQDGMAKKLTLNLYNSASNMAKRLEELLDLAKFARGTFKIDLKPVALCEYLNDVIERFLPLIEQNRQFLNLNIAHDLPVAQIDSSRLEQVIINLLSNASKYSPENSEIGFKAAVEDANLRIDIEDHGIGISPEDLERLFQPYHRVEQDRQKYPGIGLGLAVAKQIVETQGGKIWVTSQSGSGSTFSLSIPLNLPDK